MFLNYANEQTPVTGSKWKNLTDDERLDVINVIKDGNESFKLISISGALADGHIFVTFNEDVEIAERGGLLLDFEEELKDKLDEGLSVWCEPLGDRNSLRNLRGIEIKT